MKYRWAQFVLAGWLLASGLEVKPDSLFFPVSLQHSYYTVLDTVTLYNPSDTQVTIDTVLVKFLNGSSADFPGVWSYGVQSVTLRYVKDSLFILDDYLGLDIHYTVQPHDSLHFMVRIIGTCYFCNSLPRFPKATKFRFYFATAKGQRASFLLTLDPVTTVAEARVQYLHLPSHGRGQSYNLQGKRTDVLSPAGVTIRNAELRCAFHGKIQKASGKR